MPNSFINVTITALAIGIPFFFRYWVKTQAQPDPAKIDQKVAHFTIAEFVLLYFSLITSGSDSSAYYGTFAAAVLGIGLLYWFRGQEVQQAREVKVTAKTQAIHSFRKLLGMLFYFGVYFIITAFLSQYIGTPAAILAGILGVVATAPIMIRICYSCNPMYPSELKSEILSVFKAAKLNIGEIYLMDTHSFKLYNAMVCGRTLFLTQNLFEKLEPEELKAVICHEASHFKLKHIAKRIFAGICITAISMVLIGLFNTFLLMALELKSKGAQSVLFLTGIVMTLAFQLYWLFKVIRKQEFEADVHALNLGGSGAALVSALEKLTRSNGSSFKAESLLTRLVLGHAHPSFEERKEAIFNRQIPTSAQVLPPISLMVSYVCVIIALFSFVALKAPLVGKGFPLSEFKNAPKG